MGNLLLTNADFRVFVDDLATVGRQIFADTAGSLSEASQHVAEQIRPSEEELSKVQGAGADEDKKAPTNEDLRHDVTQAAEAAADGVTQTGRASFKSAKEHLASQQKDALLYRLKQAVLRLRERTDYSDSVSTLGQLVQRYAKAYSRVAEETLNAASDDVDINADLKEAMQRFWALLRSFGDAEEWKLLEDRFYAVLRHANKDPEFETLMSEIGNSLQEMLTDPKFFDKASDKVEELKEKSKQVGAETGLRQDMDAFLKQAKLTLRTVADDTAVSKMVDVTKKLYRDVWSAFQDRKSELPSDMLNVFVPLLIRSIQHVPIPRLEISSPEIDLLVENLIIEPGRTINHSSFLPYRTHLTTRNDIEIIKRHSKRTDTEMTTTFTATVYGLTVSASDFGYWLRAHAGYLFRLKDEGIASFYLDKRGIDISLDIRVGRDRLEQIFELRGVRVRIHRLNYTVSRSRWRFLLWLTKPFLKHMIRRVIEKKIAEQIVAAAQALNRELVFARERLRATRIANPQDLATFVRAVLARLTPRGSPDVESRVGLDAPRKGVFKGVYAPGSLVKVWHEEADRAQEAVEEGDESRGLHRTWRNEIFDVAGA